MSRGCSLSKASWHLLSICTVGHRSGWLGVARGFRWGMRLFPPWYFRGLSQWCIQGQLVYTRWVSSSRASWACEVQALSIPWRSWESGLFQDFLVQEARGVPLFHCSTSWGRGWESRLVRGLSSERAFRSPFQLEIGWFAGGLVLARGSRLLQCHWDPPVGAGGRMLTWRFLLFHRSMLPSRWSWGYRTTLGWNPCTS